MIKIWTLLVSFVLTFGIANGAINFNEPYTVSESDLVVCLDGKKYTKNCEPGNIIPGTPHLAFTDFINGPAAGLGDGLGSGTIVTVWGYNLGSTQGDNTIEFCDSAFTCREGHIYYWKDADGVLPSGPANLHESHGMQEIAFSIPNSAAGLGVIRVTTGIGLSNSLPFTVRAGNIYHLRSFGSDTTGTGSFSTPWLTFDHLNDNATGAGPTVYIHDVDHGTSVPSGQQNGFRINSPPNATADVTNNWNVSAYPNHRPTATGTRGITSRSSDAMAVSKIAVYASNSSTVATNGQPENKQENKTYGIHGSKDGRVIGNAITDIPGWCANGSQGAILANAEGDGDEVSNLKIYGNEVYDYGCNGSSKLHHTTYISNRSDSNFDVGPPDIRYNYFHNNFAKNGIHVYDQDINGGCGTWTGEVVIAHNVVIGQGGAGINVATSGCNAWTNDFDIYSNIVVDAGNAAAWDGVNFSSVDGPNTAGINIEANTAGLIKVRNNLVYKWNDDDQDANRKSAVGIDGIRPGSLLIEDNVFLTDKDKAYFDFNDNVTTDIVASGNLYFTTAGTSTLAVPPTYDLTKITTDPMLTFDGFRFSVNVGSPVINQSDTDLTRDIYGAVRGSPSNIGAVQ